MSRRAPQRDDNKLCSATDTGEVVIRWWYCESVQQLDPAPQGTPKMWPPQGEPAREHSPRRGSRYREEKAIDERSAGLDVPKKTGVACRMIRQADGGWEQQTRTIKTMTTDLLAWADWLRVAGVTPVAMGSTGVYWRPLYTILASAFTVLVVDAKPIKYVPGRKTDVKDAAWIAEVLDYGLFKPRFVPAALQRALRDLVR
jgi:hypothetical protein